MQLAGRRAAPVPREGEIFLDARGAGRSLRISRHAEAGVVVLSLWRSTVCVGTFRLPVEEVPDLVAVLRDGLHASYDAAHDHAGAHAADPLHLASEI